MISAGLVGVDFIVANTDAQALQMSLAPTKIQLGNDLTKGLGAGANPEIGRRSTIEERRGDQGGLLQGGRYGLHHRRHGRRYGHRGGSDCGPDCQGDRRADRWCGDQTLPV